MKLMRIEIRYRSIERNILYEKQVKNVKWKYLIKNFISKKINYEHSCARNSYIYIENIIIKSIECVFFHLTIMFVSINICCNSMIHMSPFLLSLINC